MCGRAIQQVKQHRGGNLMSILEIPKLVGRIYGIVAKLESLFPTRKFAPDGIMAGSIGEVLVAHHYDLKLLPSDSATHDASSPDGRYVKVKTTQRKSIDIRSMPEHLLVLRLEADGRFTEFYNGPGELVWEKIVQGRPLPKAGFYTISLAGLARLQREVRHEQKIERVRVTCLRRPANRRAR